MAEEDRGEVKASRRAAAYSQVLTFEDVAALSHHFGVSYQAALFRLKSLAIVNAPEFKELREKENFGLRFLELLKLWDDLYGKETRSPDRELISQVVHLALEAFRRRNLVREIEGSEQIASSALKRTASIGRGNLIPHSPRMSNGDHKRCHYRHERADQLLSARSASCTLPTARI